MSIIKSSGAGDQPSTGFFSHTLDQSLRCNGSNEYLTRTPSTSGNRRTWTWSSWVKLAVDGVRFPLIEAYSNGTNFDMFNIHTDGRILFYTVTSATDYGGLTTQRLTDPSAWYHIVFRFDSTQSTAADRIRIYINGTQQETTNPFTTDYGTLPQNYDSFINHTVPNHIIKNTNSSQYGQGYIAEVHHVDGTSYGPDTFGETVDGVCVPKAASGVSYGTNGFYLDFADSSDIGNNANTTDGTNDFTVNNFTAIDVVPDSPTNNFATLNSVGEFYGESSNTKTFSEGNLKVAQSGGGSHDTATIGIETGDTQGYYWEVIVSSMDTARTYIGILSDSPDGGSNLIASYYFLNKYVLNRNGTLYGNADRSSTTTATYTAYAQGDIVMVAYKNGKIWFGVNGTWMNSGDPANGTGFLTAQDGTSPSGRNQSAWLPYFGYRSTFIVNFGQNGTFNGTKTAQGNSDENGIGNFYYSVPSGFLTLCTSNLPDPTFGPGQDEQSDDHFNTVLYTGDGTTSRSITGVGFTPDWIWGKSRSNAEDHFLHDTVRGAGKKLESNNSDPETTTATAVISAFESDGFTGPSSTPGNINVNSRTYVTWNWKAGGSASSNSNGSITSSVSANTDAGFSIGTFTGTGSAGTLGHGLSSAPEGIILKSRGSTADWLVFHKDITDSPTHIMFLNATNKNTDQSRFNDTNPTSSVFSVGPNNAENQSGINYVFYCFHSVEGYSKFGSYHGNGLADGTFIYTGFRPAWLMIKSDALAGTNWNIFDNKRSTFNLTNDAIFGSQSNTEYVNNSSTVVDMLANGFKARSTYGDLNQAAHKIIYFAFAEAPFKFANAR